MSMSGNISRRPNSISSDSTSLLASEKALKLPLGPTMERPGPTLPMQVKTPVTVVVKSKSSSDTSSMDAAHIATNAAT